MGKRTLIKVDETKEYPITEKNRIMRYDVQLISAHPQDHKYGTAAFISLYSGSNKRIGLISFLEDWVDIEENNVNEGSATSFAFPMHKYPYVIDLLRNEAPLYLQLDPNAKVVKIITKKEPVGEGE